MTKVDFADSEEGGMALLYASEKGDGSLVRALLLLGVDVNFMSVEDNPMTPLAVAVVSDHAHIVKLLIAAGAEVNARFKYHKTVLMVGRDNEIIRDLLDAGADVFASDVCGMTPLMYQAEFGNLEGVEILLESGADPNAKDYSGNTALIQAILAGYGNIQESLIAAGANPKVVGDIGHIMYEPSSKVIFN